MVQPLYPRIQSAVILCASFALGTLLLYFYGENSSDISILRFLHSNPASILNGDMYLVDPAAQSWSPFIGYVYTVIPANIPFSYGVRVLNFVILLAVVLLTKIENQGLIIFLMIPAFILPQDDILGFALISLYFYLKNERKLNWNGTLDILFMLVAFFMIKVFIYAAFFVAIKNWKARIYSGLFVLGYLFFQYEFNGQLLYVNGDINNSVFVENSVNLYTALTYLGLPYGRIIFSLIFLSLTTVLVFSEIRTVQLVMADWLILFFGLFFYWSPEYTIWLLPFIYSFTLLEKRLIYVSVILAWSYNFIRGAFIRDWIELPMGLANLNIAIGLLIGFFMFYVLNSRLRRNFIAK